MLEPALLRQTSEHIGEFMAEWRSETPLVIHSRHDLDRGGYHAWTREFANWLTRTDRREGDPESRLRLVRAMRQLRNLAPREHDVIWRVFSGEPVEKVCAWLNDRAIRGGHPERYSLKDTVVIIVSGIDKLAYWY